MSIHITQCRTPKVLCVSFRRLCYLVLVLATVSLEHKTKRASIELRHVQLASNLLELESTDFVTGERIAEACDVAIFSQDYLDAYPTVRLHAKQVIIAGTVSLDTSKVIRSSRTFFLKMDTIEYFLTNIKPLIQEPYVLVTHMSDITAGGQQYLLKDSKLLAWYGCNIIPHRKTVAIPLGLENADMWKRTNFELILDARKSMKSKLMYMYFDTKSNVKVRSSALRALERNGFHLQKRVHWDEYIRELSTYKFCASPEGNGVDTHRMWECLYLGVIPIVVKVAHLEFAYSKLPILWVNSFSEVTPEFLRGVTIGTPSTQSFEGAIFTMRGFEDSVHKQFEHALHSR